MNEINGFSGIMMVSYPAFNGLGVSLMFYCLGESPRVDVEGPMKPMVS